MDAEESKRIDFAVMLLETPVSRRTSKAEAVQLAREWYGFAASAESLPGEHDENFHLRSGDGREFVLKVMHPARERSFIDLQCAALQHLFEYVPQLALPRVVLSLNGEPFNAIAMPDGMPRFVWMLGFIRGSTLAKVRPHTPELIADLGKFLGNLDAALKSFTHPAATRDLKWDLSRAGWIRGHLRSIPDSRRRSLIERFLDLYESDLQPALPNLRHSVIYGDANDHNVLVSDPWPQPRHIAGVIDFGDMHHGVTASEIAIAAAYAILEKADPLAWAASLLRGYHDAFPLGDAEIAALYSLIGLRLAVSVVNSALRKSLKPSDPYVTVSEAPAWEALERWAQIHPRFAHFAFRAACDLAPVPHQEAVAKWLRGSGGNAASILPCGLRNATSMVFDLSVGSTFLGADPNDGAAGPLTEMIFGAMRRAGAVVGVGRYDEPRLLYTSPLFGDVLDPANERRTVHLGIDLFVEPGTSLRAPLDGIVHTIANNAAALDYGPVVILVHKTDAGDSFFTLYGHLSIETLQKLRIGQALASGEEFAYIGASHENGGWAPHVHFQIILDLLEHGNEFPGVARASERNIWTSLSPDPNLLLGIPEERFPPQPPTRDQTLASRRAFLGRGLSVSYQRPLKIVRGWKQYLYDETGRAYLDVYNNVPLVGHSHPRVVDAVEEQLALLNTNTRYLHDNLNRYAERLTQLLPEPLRVCFFLNSGSEANELALRLARAHTKAEDVLVLDHAYHGHTSTLIDISPHKFSGPGGSGKKPWVHVAPLPDDYRGPYRRNDPQAGKKYAAHVAEILANLQRLGRQAAAFIAETLPSVGGQIVFPPGYLAEVYQACRAAGVVCIADEVQVAFGRLGTHFWGFETQGVVPDIVVMGKPIGNGFPLAAVVTSRAIAESFANGMEFFSTFGGNPVACAAGLAVLDVLRDEDLQENALRVGDELVAALRDVQGCHPLIGDVRGSGLFLGLDLVKDRQTREPARNQASYVVNRLRENGILTGTDGPHHNVIKLRPPLVFSSADAELFVRTLESVLGEDAAQP
jgi:4-aminobutyrate aminotransferase-like enzyme/Ser/Thr protein kinase RdoA (MazF antagonist)